MSKTNNYPVAQQQFAQGLSAVAGRLESKAAAVLTQGMSKTTDPYLLAALAQSVSAVAGRLEPQDAARLADALTQAMSKTIATDPRPLAGLAQGQSELAGRLEPKDAARLAEVLTQAISKTTDPYLLAALAQSLSAVAGRLEPKDAARLAEVLTQAMSKTTDPQALARLAQGLSAVAARTQPGRPDVAQWSAVLLATVGLPSGSACPLATPAVLAPALVPLPCRFSTPELVELLKQPLCVGPARRVVLDQLEHRYHRSFADRWDFVRFAQEQNLDLDFTTPPQRLAQPAADEMK
jgi:hypothetical protein